MLRHVHGAAALLLPLLCAAAAAQGSAENAHQSSPGSHIALMSIPARGHVNLLIPLALDLVQRHRVTAVLCDHSYEAFEEHLAPAGVEWLSAGACDTYNGKDEIMTRLIREDDSEAMQDMMLKVAQLGKDMAHAVASAWACDADSRPDVLVYDADTFAGPALTERFGIPGVAMVGTGFRDPYTSPVWLPISPIAIGQGRLDSSLLWRLANAAGQVFMQLVATPGYTRQVQEVPRRDLMTQAAFQCPSTGLSVEVPGWVPADQLPAWDPQVPFQGTLALYNTNYGLEYPRPTLPTEHVVGMLCNTAPDGNPPLGELWSAWLSASDVPVVYIAFGSMSARGAMDAELAALVQGFAGQGDVRVILASAAATGTQVTASPTNATFVPVSGSTCAEAGCVVLTRWAPQVALLHAPQVRLFMSHGGMNSVAEGIAAQLPMFCMPLFGDQPDNCQRIEDRGMGQRVFRKELIDNPAAVVQRMVRVARNGSEYAAGLARAAAAQRLAGGVPRAVQLIEGVAAEPGVFLSKALLPHGYSLPLWRRYGVDMLAVGLLLVCVLAWVAGRLSALLHSALCGKAPTKAKSD